MVRFRAPLQSDRPTLGSRVKLSTAARRLLGRPFHSDSSHTLLPSGDNACRCSPRMRCHFAPRRYFWCSHWPAWRLFDAPLIGLAVAAVLLVVVSVAGQNVHAYPSWWGRLQVVTTNLGATGGRGCQRLMVDHTFSPLLFRYRRRRQHRLMSPFVYGRCCCRRRTSAIMAMNLRGVRNPGLAFAIPTYTIAGIGI